MNKHQLINRLRKLEARSLCQRGHVACLILDKHSEVLAQSHNGCVPRRTCLRPDEQGNCGCLHAEVVAASFYRWDRRVCSVWVSRAPCERCAMVIATMSPQVVYYLEDSWPMKEGFKILDAAGIVHVKVLPE